MVALVATLALTGRPAAAQGTQILSVPIPGLTIDVFPSTNPVPAGADIIDLHTFSLQGVDQLPLNAQIELVEIWKISSGVFNTGTWVSVMGLLRVGLVAVVVISYYSTPTEATDGAALKEGETREDR